MLYLDVRLKPLYTSSQCIQNVHVVRWRVAEVDHCIPWNVEVDDIVVQKLDKVETLLEVWTMDRKDVWREDIDDLLWGKWREVEVKRMHVESRRHFLRLVDGMGEGFCWGGLFEGTWRGRHIAGLRTKWKRSSWPSCLIIGVKLRCTYRITQTSQEHQHKKVNEYSITKWNNNPSKTSQYDKQD